MFGFPKLVFLRPNKQNESAKQDWCNALKNPTNIPKTQIARYQISPDGALWYDVQGNSFMKTPPKKLDCCNPTKNERKIKGITCLTCIC